MKKAKLLLLIVICVCLVGCSCNKKDKDKDKDQEKNEKSKEVIQIENTIKDLYTDESKLVFDNSLFKIVVFYEGNSVTCLQHYYEYESKEDARSKYKDEYDILKNNTQIKYITLSDNYIVYTMAESEYEGKTLDDFKENYSFLIPIYKD